MRLGLIVFVAFALLCAGCSGASEGNTSQAADEILKDAPKPTGKYDDMPDPPGGISRGDTGEPSTPRSGK